MIARFCIGLMLLCVLQATASEGAGAGEWTPEQQAVINAVSNGPLGIESDFSAWADGYSAAWSYWRLGDRSVRAREPHMEMVREYIDAGNRPTGFDLHPVDVVIRGDVAMLRLIAKETLVSDAGQIRVVRYASATMLVREDGAWKSLATNIVYLDDVP